MALEYITSWLHKLDTISIKLSCHFSSTGPYKLATRPFGTATDWNFMAWTFLCPLYSTLWFLPGRETGLTFTWTNPKQFRKAPLAWKVALANISKLSGESQGWFSKWLQCVYVVVNFFISVNFYFSIVFGMVMYANDSETKEKQKLPEITWKKLTATCINSL